MTRPCRCGLALLPRPGRLFGLADDEADGAPGSVTGSHARGRLGLPSAANSGSLPLTGV